MNKDFNLKNPRSLIHLKKCIRTIELVKLIKVLEQYPKLKVVMNLNSFNELFYHICR